MKVGIPREVKNHEYRVAITPAGVHELTRHGHEVFIETDAGVGSSITNDEYVAAGAHDPARPPTTSGHTGDLILKVKEPIAEEYHRMRKEQVLFTYLHLAASRECTDALHGVRNHRHRLRDRRAARPLAAAARADVRGGRPDGPAGGCGHAAARQRRPRHAARRRAWGQGGQGGRARRWRVRAQRRADRRRHGGATSRILDINAKRLAEIDRLYQGRLQTLMSSSYAIEQDVLEADLVIGAVLIPGAKAPKLVTNDLVARMKPGAVLVDIAIDQGGCFEGSRPTTHADPTFKVHDTVFYCVANMPGAVPHTSTYALTNVTLPYAVQLANLGWREALREQPGTASGAEHPRRSDHLRSGGRGVRPAHRRRSTTSSPDRSYRAPEGSHITDVRALRHVGMGFRPCRGAHDLGDGPPG